MCTGTHGTTIRCPTPRGRPRSPSSSTAITAASRCPFANASASPVDDGSTTSVTSSRASSSRVNSAATHSMCTDPNRIGPPRPAMSEPNASSSTSNNRARCSICAPSAVGMAPERPRSNSLPPTRRSTRCSNVVRDGCEMPSWVAARERLPASPMAQIARRCRISSSIG